MGLIIIPPSCPVLTKQDGPLSLRIINDCIMYSLTPFVYCYCLIYYYYLKTQIVQIIVWPSSSILFAHRHALICICNEPTNARVLIILCQLIQVNILINHLHFFMVTFK